MRQRSPYADSTFETAAARAPRSLVVARRMLNYFFPKIRLLLVQRAFSLMMVPRIAPDELAATVVHELIQANIDSRDGLHEAAAQVDDMTLIAVLQNLAFQRNGHISELRALLGPAGQAVTDSGSFGAAVRRVWLDVRAAIAGGPAAVLEEVERAEDRLLDIYESALPTRVGGGAHDAVRRQIAAVRQARTRIRDLREQYRTESSPPAG